MEAWYMDNNSKNQDQRLEHRQTPNQPVSIATLSRLGVSHLTLDADTYETDPKLAALCERQGYDYHDIVEFSQVDRSLYEEHIHEDEEIRFVLAGSGYFDVRDEENRWIRIRVGKNDMLIVPEGIYHRFTVDTSNYMKVMRFFQGVPVWTPYVRPVSETHPSRIKYMREYLLKDHKNLDCALRRVDSRRRLSASA